MTVTKEDAQMLATLAAHGRAQSGLGRWETAGIVAALRGIRQWSLLEAMAEVAAAAADPEAETPGVIGKQRRRGDPLAPTPPPERVDRKDRCTVCSLSEPACRIRWAADHPFSPPEPPPGLDTHRIVEHIRGEVAAKRGEPVPEPPGLAGVENSPRVQAMEESMRAAREALAKEREQAEEVLADGQSSAQ